MDTKSNQWTAKQGKARRSEHGAGHKKHWDFSTPSRKARSLRSLIAVSSLQKSLTLSHSRHTDPRIFSGSSNSPLHSFILVCDRDDSIIIASYPPESNQCAAKQGDLRRRISSPRCRIISWDICGVSGYLSMIFVGWTRRFEIRMIGQGNEPIAAQSPELIAHKPTSPLAH